MSDDYRNSTTIKMIKIDDVKLEIDVVMIWDKKHRISSIKKGLIKTIRILCPMCEL